MQSSAKNLPSSIPYLLSSFFFHPLLLIWLLTLPALSPLFQPTLIRSADGLLHLYRLVALDTLIRQGVFFARWLPDLAYGYGLPLFVFYAPLSYYFTEFFHLSGLDVITAINASTALALLLAATGVYLFIKDLFGVKAGILAGVAYVYAPYTLFNAFGRGSLPVTWAAALFPLTFWAFGRLLRHHRPGDIALSALTLGAALLMHNISSLLFLPLLLFYLAVELTFYLKNGGQRSAIGGLFWRVGLALMLGLGLAAFFLLPANLEKEFAQVQRVITPPDFDYHAHFVSLGQLFALPDPANTGLLNPPDPLTLGIAQVILAAIGLIRFTILDLRHVPRLGVFRIYDKKPPPLPHSPAPLLPYTLTPLLFATISLFAAIFMMLPVSVTVWDSLPLLAFVQHPHRLLGVTAFLLAILAGAAVTGLPNRWSLGLTLTGIGAIFITAVPLLYPRYYSPLPALPTLSGMMAYEQATGSIGTTSFGEYLPIWVQQAPRESPLLPLYQTGAAIERLDRAYLPLNTTIESARYSPNQAELSLNAPEAYQAIFHTFYFPGWQAEVDGQPAPIAPVTERGLIGISVPAGLHQVRLYFSETPLRLTANIISLLALLAIIGIGLKTFNLKTLNLKPANASPLRAIFILALALILIKTIYLDYIDNPLKRVFSGGITAGADVSRQVNFGQQINLLGYDLPNPAAAPGQSFELTLYWQARQPLTADYSALAQLVDDQQHLYAGQDNLHPGNLPARRWESWGFVRDTHTVSVPPGTPPGNYYLATGLYDPVTWARLPALEGSLSGWADTLPIPVTVIPATQPPSLEELGIKWLIQSPEECLTEFQPSSFIPHPCLLGATPERESIRPNDFLRIALFWEALETPGADYQVKLRLLAADGAVAIEETSQPSHGRYPTPRWSAGERVRDNHAWWILPDFAVGTYRLQARLLDEAGQPVGEWIELGEMSVEEVIPTVR